MVGYQDVDEDSKSIALPVVFDPFQVVKSAPIVAKDLLALIATVDDVVKRPFKFHPRFPGHAAEHIQRCANKSIFSNIGSAEKPG